MFYGNVGNSRFDEHALGRTPAKRGTSVSDWRHSGIFVDWVIAGLATLICFACFLWNIEAPTRLGVAILSQQYMALQLGLALTIAFLRYGPDGKSKSDVGWVDGLIAAVAFCVLMYAAWDFSWLLHEQAYRPWQITMIGAVVTVVVMEGVRRRAGWMLFSIVAVFLIYALFADRIPGRLIGKELSPIRLVQYVGFDPSAVFSTPLAVGTKIVLLFVFFGRLLFAAGGWYVFYRSGDGCNGPFARWQRKNFGCRIGVVWVDFR
jgi:TRAP-type uncharacterized transport system fused permease subunit